MADADAVNRVETLAAATTGTSITAGDTSGTGALTLSGTDTRVLAQPLEIDKTYEARKESEIAANPMGK